MIDPKYLCDLLTNIGADLYTGVPDSLLKSFCAYVTENMGERHIIAANEGCAVGLAAGNHLAAGGVPVVYMQNSGLGNAVNPLLSLTDPEVYSIPMILLIGWRGEPGTKDEPQHIKQGKITCGMLETMGIEYLVMSDEEKGLREQIAVCDEHLKKNGSPFAFVIRKGTFTDPKENKTQTPDLPTREEAIEAIIGCSEDDDIFVSTTGMASRELYEIRERRGQDHSRDFLTVGSMGHASQIATGIAINKQNRKVFCIDGDGAVIMHMGGMSTIGTVAPKNMVHVILNNGAHDSVGGQPTVGLSINIPNIAESMGYRKVFTVETIDDLEKAVRGSGDGPTLIEVKVRKGARKDLGRPKETPKENKKAFMEFIE